MAYIKDTDILNATDGGLTIILYYYPNANKVLSKTARQFKVRESEKTASASLKKLDNGVYVVTDFGGDQKPRNGIQVCALEEGITYTEACNLLGSRYEVKGAEIKHVKPDFERRPLKADEIKGQYDFETKEFSETELALLGPRVNAEHCNEYGLVSLKSFTKCKENEALVTIATDEYPIFMFDLDTWQKIYQPNNAEKRYRFQHAGNKPARHMFGLDVIKKEFAKRKKRIEDDYDYDDDDENDDEKKKKKDARFDYVFYCSGGSDGLNLRSFEKYPVWFNSESEHMEYSDYKDLKIYAKEIIYVGDIDSTGVKQAIEVGLKFMDIKLMWLPEKLKAHRDKRGNPRKDFKDYVDVYYRHEAKDLSFQNGLNKLIENALPMQFWTEKWTKSEGYRYTVSNTRLYHFLKLLGFGRYESESLKEGYIFIKKEGNVVKVLEPYKIANFVHTFLEDRGMTPNLRDYVYKSPALNEKSFSNLPAVNIDFTNATKHIQYMFFSRKILRITADSITELKQGEIENFVWEDKIIDHPIKKDEPHFIIKFDESGTMDIEIKKTGNMYFNFLINASRVHWKYELEDYFDDKSGKDADEYFKKHKFDIAGPNLNEDQQLEQKLHLINKIYTIGYMLHTYKNYNKPWAVFAMDNKIAEMGESHGGSGKSLAYSFLNKILKRRHYLKGRDPKLTQNEFIYHGVTEDTDYIMIDDATQYLDFNFFFSEITGSLKVNPKNGAPYEIPFEKSPKFLITSNFTIRDMDPSKFRRLLFAVFSDYYHSSNDDDDYRQARKVSDDFGGRNLFTDFTPEDYNDFYNFCAQCLQFYLKHEVKINPPMDNVTKRSLQAEMGDPFMGWAEGFFDRKTDQDVYLYRDTSFSKEMAFEDFQKSTKLMKWTPNKFKKAMRAWCKLYGWEFNPLSANPTNGRIVQKIDGKTQEVFYLATTKADDLITVQEALADEPEEDQKTVFDRD